MSIITATLPVVLNLPANECDSCGLKILDPQSKTFLAQHQILTVEGYADEEISSWLRMHTEGQLAEFCVECKTDLVTVASEARATRLALLAAPPAPEE